MRLYGSVVLGALVFGLVGCGESSSASGGGDKNDAAMHDAAPIGNAGAMNDAAPPDAAGDLEPNPSKVVFGTRYASDELVAARFELADPINLAEFEPVTASPYDVGPNPQAVVADPDGKFLFVVNDGDGEQGSVSAFKISATRALTEVPGSPFDVQGRPVAAAIEPEGSILYVVNGAQLADADGITAFEIDATTGELTQLDEPVPLSGNPYAITIESSGSFAYVATLNGGILPVPIGSNGVVEPVGASVAAGMSPRGIATDPLGKFLYVANAYSRDVSAFKIDPDDGALTAVTGSPFDCVTNPEPLIVDPSGKFLYVSGSAGTSAFKINASTGALTPAPNSPASYGAVTGGLTIEKGRNLLYLGSSDGSITALSFDATTGALSYVARAVSDVGFSDLTTVD